MVKRNIAFALAALVALAASIAVNAGTAIIGDRSYEYTRYTGVGYTNVSIHAISPTAGDISIPDVIGDGNVTALSYDQLRNLRIASNDTTSICLPVAITSIPYGCFKDCVSLTNINLECITSYGYRAFENCSNLVASIHVTKNTTFGMDSYPRGGGASYTFLNCRKIKDVIIDEGASLHGYGSSVVGDGIFKGCGIEHIEIPSSMKTIGKETFAYTDLQEVILPEGVEDASYGFCNCPDLTKVSIGRGVRDITSAFSGCGSLTEVEFDANTSLTSISASAFSECTSLAEITIPEGVVSIDANAFSRASSLEKVSIPGSVTAIDRDAFRETGFTDVEIPGHVKTVYGSFESCPKLTNVVVHSGVESIRWAFDGCTNLLSVTLPEGLRDISSAFWGCTHLQEVDVPNTVTNMASAFRNCYALKKANIPDGMVSLGGSAFDLCYTLEEIVIPSSVTNIENYALLGLSSANVVLGENVKGMQGDALYSKYGGGPRQITALCPLPGGSWRFPSPRFTRYVIAEEHLNSWLPVIMSAQGGYMSASNGKVNYAVYDRDTGGEVAVLLLGGGAELVQYAAALGLDPARGTGLDGGKTIAYAKPTISISAFDREAGRVEVRVCAPNDGVVARGLAEECVVIEGSDDLKEWSSLSSVVVEASNYASGGAEGRFACLFNPNGYRFFKVYINGK